MFFNILKRKHSVGFETSQIDEFIDSIDSQILDKSHFRKNYNIVTKDINKNFKIQEIKNAYSRVQLKLIICENLCFNISLSYIFEESKFSSLFIIDTNKKYDFPVFYRNYNSPGFMDLIILLDNIYYGIRISKYDDKKLWYLNKPLKKVKLYNIYLSNLYKINYDGIYTDDAYRDFKLENVA